MKPKTKKETTLSVLIEILEVLKELSHARKIAAEVFPNVASEDNLATIIDDGTKSTSELLKDIGCPYYSYLSDAELDEQFPKVKTNRKFTWVQEADEELKNLSAEDLKKTGIQCITLRERLIMEKMWFDKMGTHLDIDNWTLCAGSRYADGDVPFVRWYGDELYVYGDGPRDAYGGLRARAVAVS